MRELLSLRRDETPVIGETYRYKNRYLQCVEDNDAYGCYRCVFCETSCRRPCDVGKAEPTRHFELAEVAVNGDITTTLRDIKETRWFRPREGQRYRAGSIIVEYHIARNWRSYEQPCRLCAIKGLGVSCAEIRCSQATNFGYYQKVAK